MGKDSKDLNLHLKVDRESGRLSYDLNVPEEFRFTPEMGKIIVEQGLVRLGSDSPFTLGIYAIADDLRKIGKDVTYNGRKGSQDINTDLEFIDKRIDKLAARIGKVYFVYREQNPTEPDPYMERILKNLNDTSAAIKNIIANNPSTPKAEAA